MFLALAEALQARDAFSGAHSLRVATLASTVGERLGWEEARLTRLRIGALLHDVGKLAVPTKILRKPGPLTRTELAHIHYHPVAGARLVQALAPARATLACALYHHERWDGHHEGHREGDDEDPPGQKRPPRPPAQKHVGEPDAEGEDEGRDEDL